MLDQIKFVAPIVALLGIFLGACTSGPGQPSEPVQADCFVFFNLAAWEDADGDGEWDEDEAPLKGVEFSVLGNYAHSLAGGKGSSDENGEASIDTWAPGSCPEDYDFMIQVEVLSGYELTTESPLHHDGSSGLNGSYSFGFGK